MYAVIRAGGKQYRVAPGDVIRLENQGNGTDGKIEFNDVLAVSGSWSSITSARSNTKSCADIARDTPRCVSPKSRSVGRNSPPPTFRRKKQNPRKLSRWRKKTLRRSRRRQSPQPKRQQPRSQLGSSRNGRDSNAQRLGFKAFGGQVVPGGTIIVRQRGTRVKPGLNVGRGKDDTLFAKISGRIKFMDKGSMGKFVMIEPLEAK